MPNAFRAARAEPVAPPRDAALMIHEVPPDSPIAAVLAEFCQASREAKQASARAEKVKATLRAHAETAWIDHLADGHAVKAPLRLVNPITADSVTFVVQDRCDSTPVDDQVVNDLTAMLGKTFPLQVVTTERFHFRPDILDQAAADNSGTVREFLGTELARTLARAKKSGKLSRLQADEIIEVQRRSTLDSGFLERLPALCRHDRERIVQALRLLGGSIVRYIRA